MKRILSIAGGGMRGVIPARFLQEIETVVPGVKWDLIAGTSTGAILGALLSAPQPVGASDILKWYYNEGPKIFSESVFHKPEELWAAKYGGESLYSSLQACVGAHAMSECNTLFTCATVNADAIRPVWLDQTTPWAAWECAAASSSAQTYFPAFSKAGTRYIDGGNFANNPVRHAANLARKLWPSEEITVIHLGTGEQTTPKPLPEGGLLQWAPIVFGEMSSLQDTEANRDALYAASVITLNVSMNQFPSMDAADKATLDGYVAAAESQIIRNPRIWNQIEAALK
jgi:predicted acylesterase/phospholipase RssA